MTAAEDLACRELVELASDYLEGVLPAERARTLEEHLAICEGCLEYVEELRQAVRVARTLDEVRLSPAARDSLLGAFRAWRAELPARGAAGTPEEVHARFVERFLARDLDGLVDLYTEDAVFLPSPGVAVRGRDAIRGALDGFLALGGTFRMAPPRVVAAGDVALVCADWNLDATGPDGAPVRLSGTTSDVVRRGADGAWRFAVDSPFGPAGA